MEAERGAVFWAELPHCGGSGRASDSVTSSTQQSQSIFLRFSSASPIEPLQRRQSWPVLQGKGCASSWVWALRPSVCRDRALPRFRSEEPWLGAAGRFQRRVLQVSA